MIWAVCRLAKNEWQLPTIGNCQFLECRIYIDHLLAIGNCHAKGPIDNTIRMQNVFVHARAVTRNFVLGGARHSTGGGTAE